MLISKEYADLNRQMHETQPNYGVIGHEYAFHVQSIMSQFKTNDVLDYGCGKRTLERKLRREFAVYDPGIPGLDKPPQPHDLVVCTDVLEHIEPECLDDVLADLRRCTKKAMLCVVTCVKAQKPLPDGSNPHRIIQPPEWWLGKLHPLFEMTHYLAVRPGKRFLFVGTPR